MNEQINLLIKGKALPIGTRRKHGNQEVIKTAQGWKKVRKESKEEMSEQDYEKEALTYLKEETNKVKKKMDKKIAEMSKPINKEFLTEDRQDAKQYLKKEIEGLLRLVRPADYSNHVSLRNGLKKIEKLYLAKLDKIK